MKTTKILKLLDCKIKVAQEWSRNAGKQTEKNYWFNKLHFNRKLKTIWIYNTHYINWLGTTPLLCLSFVLMSVDFVEVFLKTCSKVMLKLFYKGNYYVVPSAIFIIKCQQPKIFKCFLMQRNICPHPVHTQTLIETSKLF